MEAPEFYHQAAGFSTLDSKPSGGTCDHFMVEDLLDFSNDTTPNVDVVMGNADFDAVITGGNYSNEDSSTLTTAVDSCNSSSLSGSDHPHHTFNSLDHPSGPHFCNDLSVPYDDMAELEWLSNFVEESFSSEEDLQKLHLISGMKTRSDPNSGPDPPNNDTVSIHTTTGHTNNTIFDAELSVPGKARSKRSRAAPINWDSRLLVLSSTFQTQTLEPGQILIGPTVKNNSKPASSRRRDDENGEGRKCQHCATDKTPQWRTGPMGPKTLCNACGVRYKSGRLVPEYRPAASPTFVLTKHSNSHRKVLELRRQKELMRVQQQQQQQQFLHQGGMVYDVASSNGDDYLIHQHVGPDFGQLI